MDKNKKIAAEYVVEKYVKDELKVGIGTGSTIEFAIEKLSLKTKINRMKIYPTSMETQMLLSKHNLTYENTFKEIESNLDLAIDGADWIDLDSKIIVKGGGGAHLREKVIAYSSNLFIVIVDESKIVKKEEVIIPLEVIPSALSFVKLHLKNMKISYKLREAIQKRGPLISDNNNFILDLKVKEREIKSLEIKLNNIPGAVANGIFNHKNAKIVYYNGNKIVEI